MKNNKKLCLAILSLLLLIRNASFAAKEKKYVLSSPDGTLKVEISAGNELAYQVMHGNDTILSHSNIGLVLENGTIVGKTPRITGERRRKIKDNIESPFTVQGVRCNRQRTRLEAERRVRNHLPCIQ